MPRPFFQNPRPAAARVALLSLYPLLAFDPAQAATLLVDQVTDSVPPSGSCAATATGSCSLRQAIASATPGDEIVFDAALASPTTAIQLVAPLQLDQDLTITGPGSSLLSIVGNNDRVVHIAAPQSVAITLRDLTVRGGFAGTTAGTQYGGGIFIDLAAGQVHLERVDLLSNTVDHPGGGGANLAVVSSGLAVQVTVEGCNFISGIARGGAQGGGAYVAGALLQIDSASFYGNEVVAGGGGALAASSNALVYLSNSTVTQNFALEPGGSLMADGGFFVIDYSTFVFNDSVGSATNAKEFYVSSAGGSISFGHTLINAARGVICTADSTANGGISSSGSNLSNEPCFLTHPNDLPVQVTGLNLSPEVSGTANWFRPLPTSPAIDGGLVPSSGGCPTAIASVALDQRGLPRPIDGNGDGTAACDVGALEVQLLYRDGFGSGDTSRWSSAQP